MAAPVHRVHQGTGTFPQKGTRGTGNTARVWLQGRRGHRPLSTTLSWDFFPLEPSDLSGCRDVAPPHLGLPRLHTLDFQKRSFKEEVEKEKAKVFFLSATFALVRLCQGRHCLTVIFTPEVT